MAKFNFVTKDGLLYFWKGIKTKLSDKVDKEDGKGLSTNDYTTDEKNKLTGISEGANANILESVKVNGVAQTITEKAVDIKVPTKVSELTNDKSYLTEHQDISGKMDIATYDTDSDGIVDNAAKVNNHTVLSDVPENALFTDTVYDDTTIKSDIASINTALSTKANSTDLPTKVSDLTNDSKFQTESEVTSAITSAIGKVTQISYSVVTELPKTGKAGIIYLISNSGKNPNIYDEYIYVNDSFEKIGSTDTDLSGYVKSEDITSVTNEEIDTILAA